MTLQWSRARQILALSAPVIAAMVAQTFSGLLGAGFVARLGLDALAGVGVAGTIYATLSMILLGLDTGVQALAARWKGEGRSAEVGGLLIDAVAFSSGAGLLLAAAASLVGPVVLRLILHSPAAAAYGSTYLIAVSPALLFVGVVNAFSAFWNATGKPKYPLCMNLLMIASGLVLGFVLMFGVAGAPRLGVAGAGVGIALANLIGAVGHIVVAVWIDPVEGFRWRPLRWANLVSIARIGAPISAQQSLVNLGGSVWFAIVGLIGSTQVALAAVFLRLENLAIYSAIGVGIGTATLVGWSMGAREIDNGRRWGWDGALVGATLNLPLALFLLVAPQLALGLFISDPAAVAMGLWPLRMIAFTLLADSVGRILGFGMRGAGVTGYIASINFLVNWVVQLPLAWLLGVQLGFGLTGMAAGRLCVVLIETLIVAALWQGEVWTGRRIVADKALA